MPRTPAVKKKREPLGATNDNRTPHNNTAQKKKKRSSPTQLRGAHAKRVKQKHLPIPNENDIEALPFPNAAEVLPQIDNDADRNLQVLLWEIDCHYVLLPHQFKGVRAMAGVMADFPGSYPPPPTQEAALLEWVITHLVNANARDDRGVLMADVMGLGKTVQCIAACMLRNALALAQGRPKKPTLIVSPNDAVGTQWFETLIRANVPPNTIFRFKTKSQQQPSLLHRFYLCNRYDLQTEARFCFERLMKTESTHFSPSPLFPNANKALLKCLRNQYQSEQGKEQNRFKANNDNRREEGKETERMNISEIITKSLSKYVGETETVFETVVIDEAHFLKNLAAYWGMAAGLLGLHANRMIPMSGTPYNNSCQDVATLMTMIDSRLESANEKWWKQATKASAAKDVQEAIQEWTSNYLIRRDKSVIASQLPQKIIRKKHVGPLPLELSVYENYESKFLDILQKFQRLEGSGQNRFQRQQMKKYFELMLAFASCMRSSLIHPLLASGGREFTVLFSPSRRTRKGMLCSQEKPNKCVCCTRNTRKKIQQTKKASLVGDFEGEFEDDDEDDTSLLDFIVSDDVVEYMDDDEESTLGNRKPKAKGKKKKKDLIDSDIDSEAEDEELGHRRPGVEYGNGEIVPLPNDLCRLAEYGIRHFACESCLQDLETCPACASAQARLRLEHGRNELMKMKMEAAKGKNTDLSPEDMDIDIPRKLYCQHIFGGFRASAKLESIMEEYNKLPAGDKVLVCSFFKGSLDLLEAMFHEIKAETARFDGDVSSEERQLELDRFKDNENCRVLLLTVQTGGTGLNLVNANHVWFVDRFWNPMVMEQAEDRCYRMGQKKDVYIIYHDVNYTTDDVMRHINDAKSENAKVILADGCQLSTSTSGMSYKDISGQLGESVRAIQSSRISYVSTHRQHIYEPLPPSPAGVFEAYEKNNKSVNLHRSLLDAIATMLGFAPPPIGSASSPYPSNASASATMPSSNSMDIDIVGTPLNTTNTICSTQPDQTRSESAVDSKADEEDTKDKKPSIMPLQTKSEAATAPAAADVLNLEETEDVKPLAVPAPLQATSKPKTSVPADTICLEDDEDEDEKTSEDSAENKQNAGVDAKASRPKNENQPENALANPKKTTQAKKANAWLDDSDDESIPEVVAFTSSTAKRGGK